MKFQCPECGRIFDCTNPTDATELAYGHDCEAWCACCGVEDPEPNRTIGANCIEADCIVPVACSVPIAVHDLAT